MKILLSIITTLLMSSAAMAKTISYEKLVGAESIIRQVLEKKLVQETSTLVSLLEGSESVDGMKIFASVVKFECDRALGSDVCLISIYSEITLDGETEDQKSEHLEELRVNIHQGAVSSASLTTISAKTLRPQ